jgi:hypothetical protein
MYVKRQRRHQKRLKAIMERMAREDTQITYSYLALVAPLALVLASLLSRLEIGDVKVASRGALEAVRGRNIRVCPLVASRGSARRAILASPPYRSTSPSSSIRRSSPVRDRPVVRDMSKRVQERRTSCPAGGRHSPWAGGNAANSRPNTVPHASSARNPGGASAPSQRSFHEMERH